MEEKLLVQPFDTIRIDAIAKELRISKRTIYEIFDSKDIIFQILVERFHESFVAQYEIVILKLKNHELTFSEGMMLLVRCATRINGLKTKEIWNKLPFLANDIKLSREQMFTELLDIAIEQGIVRKDLRKNIYFMIMNTVSAAMHDPSTRNEFEITAADFQHLHEIIHCGILTDEGRGVIEQMKPLIKK
ncbi:MAG: TetR/AcrR family transcriptional regulator [Ignavibacteria bacterium]|jgi:AcrR family transcriptional regulator|nr:TetR/AcrR family transcriptional regulator [Ignavibacteria bacterium]